MKCNDAQRHLSAKADGRLAEEFVLSVAEHCSTCEQCAAFAESLSAMRGVMASIAAPEVPVGLANRLAARKVPEGRSATWFPDFARLALPTAGIGFALAALLFLLRPAAETAHAPVESADVVDSSMNYEDLLASASLFGGEER